MKRTATTGRSNKRRLRKALADVLSDQPSRLAVQSVVTESYRMGLAYLLRKLKRGRLQPALFGLSVEDLALDCVADLFQRDETGRFDVLRKYFDGTGWQTLDQDALFIVLRRLVFSKVNENLYRRYGMTDPALSKIIRNVKDAVKADDVFTLSRSRDGLWLEMAGIDRDQETRPLAPAELVEAFLISRLQESYTVRSAVNSFVEFVRAHPHYLPAFPLTGFARALRSAFLRLGTASVEDDEPETVFHAFEVEQAIGGVVEFIRTDMQASYVSKGKVTSSVFEAYLSTVRDILSSQFVHDSTSGDSYFDALQAHLPGVDRSLYRQEHRNRLEYLAKLSRARLISHLSDG